LVATALTIAAATAYAVAGLVSDYEERLLAANVAADAGMIVVAKRDLRSGTVVTPGDVQLAVWHGTLAENARYQELSDVYDQIVGDKIFAGEPVRPQRMVSGGAGLQIHEILDPGTRAVTLRTNRAAGVGGLVRPGHFVDVIVTIRPDTKALAANWVTETILQGVKVIAVGDVVGADTIEKDQPVAKRSPREVFITLEVEPAEAEELALATSRGEIHLSLRAIDDFEMIDPGQPLVANALVGIPQTLAQTQRKRLSRKESQVTGKNVAHTTDVIRGVDVTVESFDNEGTRIDPRDRR
jgi:pilus assembly protein CpaB